jgi:hypothetical protein
VSLIQTYILGISNVSSSDFMPEGAFMKTWRRFREEPLIPLGMGLTCAALFGAARAMRKGDHKQVNLMFRRRIQAQAFTVAMIVAGSFYMADEKAKRKQLEDLERQKRAEEFKGKWLEELEVREDEDRIARERVEKLMQRRKRNSEDEKKKKAAVEASDSSTQARSNGDLLDKEKPTQGNRMLNKAKSVLGGKPKD